MTARLNVLLVQSPAMSSLQSEINAELAVQMMGVPGLDLSIITSLDGDTASDTDRLLLSSFQNDFAVLDWRGRNQILATLGRLGITGARAPHRLDPAAAAVSPGQRRLYLVDLRRGDPPAAVVDAMRALLNDRRVVAVSLTIAGPKSEASARGQAANNGRPASDVSRRPVAQPHLTDQAPLAASPNGSPDVSPQAKQTPRERVADPPHRSRDSDLDALVDGVNASDW